MLLKEFICTFDGETDRQFPAIDSALQVVMRMIWSEPIKKHEVEEEKMVKQAMVCYKLAIEEGDAEDHNEELHHIEIPETIGERDVQGPKLQNLDITQPLQITQVNIGTEDQPKFAKIGGYWDEETVSKITELLKEYQEIFPTKFSEMKGIVGALGVMRIPLKVDAKPCKQ